MSCPMSESFRTSEKLPMRRRHGSNCDGSNGMLLSSASICPVQGGLELLTELKRQHPTMPKLVLSLYPQDQYATRMLKAGASGYLTKDRSSEELVRALRKILRGDKYISDSLAQKFASDID